MKDELAGLLDKRMDRLTFLKHVAAGFVALAGIGTVVKTMTSMDSSRRVSSGYGSSSYGGRIR